MSLFVTNSVRFKSLPQFSMYAYISAALGRVLAIYMALLLVEFGQPWLDSDSVEHNGIKHKVGPVG